MKIEGMHVKQCFVQNNLHFGIDVIDHAEGRDGPGDYAKILHQYIRAAEGQAAGVKPPPERFEIDFPVLETSQQPHFPFFVAKKQVLDVRTGQLSAQMPGLFHGVQRRVIDGAVLDAHLVESFEQTFRRQYCDVSHDEILY
jgi:hypothetical protein